MIAKPKRIKDKKLITQIKTLPCTVCLKTPAGDAHHVTTVGAGGDDVESNLIPLCREHHTFGPKNIHKLGWLKFIEFHGPCVWHWLKKNKRMDVIEKAAERTRLIR